MHLGGNTPDLSVASCDMGHGPIRTVSQNQSTSPLVFREWPEHKDYGHEITFAMICVLNLCTRFRAFCFELRKSGDVSRHDTPLPPPPPPAPAPGAEA